MWVVTGIAGFILLIILVLSVPFDLKLQLEVYGKTSFSLKASWFFGLFSRDLKARKEKAPRKGREEDRKKRRFEVGKAIKTVRTTSAYLRVKGLPSHLIRFMKRVFRRIKIRRLEAEFRAGLDDPSETFYIFALTQSFNQVFNRSLPYPVYLYPSFIGPVFEGYLKAEIRLYPVLLVPPLFQLIFSLTALRVLKILVVSRWKKRV